jgi:hypothetical protein
MIISFCFVNRGLARLRISRKFGALAVASFGKHRTRIWKGRVHCVYILLHEEDDQVRINEPVKRTTTKESGTRKYLTSYFFSEHDKEPRYQ